MFKALMMLLVFIIFLAGYKVRNIDFMIYFLMSDLYIFHCSTSTVKVSLSIEYANHW